MLNPIILTGENVFYTENLLGHIQYRTNGLQYAIQFHMFVQCCSSKVFILMSRLHFKLKARNVTLGKDG